MPHLPAVHHHAHGPANRRRRVLETAAPLFVEEPSGEVRGGAVVLHDAGGLSGYIEYYCRSLAADGLLTVAPYHYYDTGGREHADPESADVAMRALTAEGLRDDVGAALDYLLRLRGQSCRDVSVLGFGRGGYLAAWSAAEHHVAAAVSVGAERALDAPPGMPPLAEVVRRRRAPWLGITAADPGALPDVVQAEPDAVPPSVVEVVPDAGPDFHRDITGDAARVGWRTVRRFLGSARP